MAPKKDKVWVGPELSDGNRPFVRENDKGRQVGVMGVNPPCPDSFVELKPLGGCCYEVTSEIRLNSSGPAQVASSAYRTGWDRLFGKPREVGQA